MSGGIAAVLIYFVLLGFFIGGNDEIRRKKGLFTRWFTCTVCGKVFRVRYEFPYKEQPPDWKCKGCTNGQA